jgi:endonuclease/exonuclease/phosphatase (EEP) superfamily protein YafD
LLHPAANASAPAVEHDPARHLRLANVNVLYSNAGHDRLLAWLRSARPDVAVIVEPTSAWAGSLGALKSDLPHALVVAKPKGDGIALYSRFPLQRSEVLYLGENRRAALVAELAVGGRPLTLVAAHPLPPRNARSTRDRDAYLRGVASILGPADGPAILAGDLNTTPWSYSFQDLVRASGLAPGPVPATWPSILGPLGIPIDHVLARGVAIETLETGPHIGSDHLPVLARLTF